MGKTVRRIFYDNLELSILVWDNDLEKYRQRKALNMLGQVVSESTTGRGGRK